MTPSPDTELKNYLYIKENEPFQMLPDYSLLMIGDHGELLVYLPEFGFVGVSSQAESGFERKRKNIVKYTVNYISLEDWKTERSKA